MKFPPAETTFSPADWAVLAACWHPVAYSADLSAAPRAVRLLDTDLVLYRSGGRVVAALDLCIHRGARLSKGWMDGDEITCAYHGFRFAADGRCTRVPAQPDLPIGSALRLTTFAAEERHGLIWVCLQPPAKVPLPDWPEESLAGARRFNLPVQEWNVAATRQVENFNDVAHLSFIHKNTFGLATVSEVIPYSVQTEPAGLGFTVPYTYREPVGGGNFKEAVITYTYGLTLPFASRLRIDFPDGRRQYLHDIASPIGRRRTRVFFLMYGQFDPSMTDSEVVDFQGRVLGEDRDIVESQHPEDLPLDLSEEFHIRADRMSTRYRKALAELGLGAPFSS
jgi:phenylpropionate dioxygenase-like ring-hydroxylating dioxygenase large terminal subunit